MCWRARGRPRSSASACRSTPAPAAPGPPGPAGAAQRAEAIVRLLAAGPGPRSAAASTPRCATAGRRRAGPRLDSGGRHDRRPGEHRRASRNSGRDPHVVDVPLHFEAGDLNGGSASAGRPDHRPVYPALKKGSSMPSMPDYDPLSRNKQPWFGPKRFGYGYGPRTWPGWLCGGVGGGHDPRRDDHPLPAGPADHAPVVVITIISGARSR